MERSAVEQEREVKDIIRRAKNNPDKTGPFRRDALKRLIDLTHSSYSNLKILAAQNIRYLFDDFPELEEEAINAVYDLCEDQSPKVRLEGYTAVTHLSNANRRLVSRNTDVLLQLLQSDEPEEVVVVKKALLEHLDMDPRVTLSVLCDQINPVEESVDDEEKATRERLRGVVLAFLTGEAKRAIIERHATPGSPAEELLMDTLLALIPKLKYGDVEIIVKNLLLPLKAFTEPSSRGRDLLEVLLNTAIEYLQKGVRSGDVSLLHATQPYLDLAAFVIERRAAPAIQLLRAYCSSMVTKITLQRFSKADQQLVVARLAETLAATAEKPLVENSTLVMEPLNRQIVDSCSFLLESLRLSPSSPQRFVQACIILLQACLRRKSNTSWTPPPNLIITLNMVQSQITKEQSEDVHNLIRSLIPPQDTATEQDNNTSQDTSSSTLPAPIKINGRDLPASLPERPPTTHSPRRNHTSTSTQSQNKVDVTFNALSSQSSASKSVKHRIPPEPPIRPPKRQKDDGNADVGPSLLSRLGTSAPNTPMSRLSLEGSDSTVRKSHSIEAEQAPPNGEWSIKGAAKQSSRDLTPPSQRSLSSSLLNRLDGGSTTRDKGGRRQRGKS